MNKPIIVTTISTEKLKSSLLKVESKSNFEKRFHSSLVNLFKLFCDNNSPENFEKNYEILKIFIKNYQFNKEKMRKKLLFFHFSIFLKIFKNN